MSPSPKQKEYNENNYISSYTQGLAYIYLDYIEEGTVGVAHVI